MGSIIGVTGTLVSGKGTFAKCIEEQGYKLFTFGGEVRAYIEEDLTSRGPNTRERQQYWGDRARIINGAGFWANRLIKKIQDDGNYVFDGFRYPDQIESFQRIFGRDFRSVAVDADPKIRFGYSLIRKRDGDPTKFKDFLVANRRDLDGWKDGTGQNTRECMKMAEHTIYNEGSKEDLKAEALKFLQKCNN